MKKNLYFILLIYTTLLAETNVTLENPAFRDKITNGYHALLNSIDCFIGNHDDINQTNYKKISKNKLYIILSSKHTKDKSFEQDLYLRANIKLPQLKERFEITLDKHALNEIDNETIDPEYDKAIEDEKLRVGLKYYFFRKPYRTTYTKLGIRIHSPHGLYAKAGIQQIYFFQELELILGGELYYYMNQSFLASNFAFTLIQPLNDTFSLEQKNEIRWKESTRTNELINILRLHHIIDKKNNLQYQLTYKSIDEKSFKFKRDWYGVNIRYRHHINHWLFVEMIPQALRREENDFIFEKAFALNFGMTFSK